MIKKSDVIARELASLELKHKKLTPELIVRIARDKRHALHSFFPWNDAKAAHRHRLDVARELLTVYVTVTVVEKSKRICVPLYLHDPALPAGEQGYVRTLAKRSREHNEAVLRNELDRIVGCVERARDLASAFDLSHRGLATQFEMLLESAIATRRALAA